MLIGDALDARDGILDGSANCPVVPIVDHVPDQAALGPRLLRSELLQLPGIVPRGLYAQLWRLLHRQFTRRRHARPACQRPELGCQRERRNQRGLTFFINNTVNASLGPDHADRVSSPACIDRKIST